MKGVNPLDVVRVGDPPDLPLGCDDPTILAWAEREQRILISRDEQLPKRLADHLGAGHHSPGVFLARQAPYAEIIEFLVCRAYASEPAEWRDQVAFIP